nr:putative methyltransferase tdie [Quercus suber]
MLRRLATLLSSDVPVSAFQFYAAFVTDLSLTRNLEPGGWLEVQDYGLPVTSADGTHENTALSRWGKLLSEASSVLGRPMGSVECSDLHVQRMQESGFVDIQTRMFMWPTNGWPKDPFMKELGRWNQINILDGLEGFCLALLTRGLGWKKEEIDVLVARVSRDLRDRKIHATIGDVHEFRYQRRGYKHFETLPNTGLATLLSSDVPVSAFQFYAAFVTDLSLTRNLEPGGWLEVQDYGLPVTSADGTHENTALSRWGKLLSEASSVLGRPMGSVECSDLHVQRMQESGFVDIQTRMFMWPTNGWPKDPFMKELGRWNQINILDGLEGFCLALLTRGLGWKKEEIDVLVARVSRDLRDRKIHAYFPMPVVYGRKPHPHEVVSP